MRLSLAIAATLGSLAAPAIGHAQVLTLEPVVSGDITSDDADAIVGAVEAGVDTGGHVIHQEFLVAQLPRKRGQVVAQEFG